jgi:hypothetical protein
MIVLGVCCRGILASYWWEHHGDMVLHTAQFLQNQELQSEELMDKRAVFFLFTSLLNQFSLYSGHNPCISRTRHIGLDSNTPLEPNTFSSQRSTIGNCTKYCIERLLHQHILIVITGVNLHSRMRNASRCRFSYQMIQNGNMLLVEQTVFHCCILNNSQYTRLPPNM